MRLTSGKHDGKLTEVLFFKEPDYVEWCIANHPTPAIRADLIRLRTKFDKKPLVETCSPGGGGCGDPATKASAYHNTTGLMFWCDDCDPYNSGARNGVLTTVRTFDDLMNHVNWFAESGRKGDKRQLVKELGMAKGLPERITEKAALAFFA